MNKIYKLQATGYEPVLKTPAPALPEGGCYPVQAISRRRFVSYELQSIIHKLQATGYLPPFFDSPDEATRAAEIRGPCRKRSRSSAVADVQTLERRGRFQTFPYR